MKGDVLVGVDAGTSVIKAVAFTREGEQTGAAAVPNSYETLPHGGVEQETREKMRPIWRAMLSNRRGEAHAA